LRGRAWVIDGDTIAIDRIKIRLAGIDAPELDEPWGQKARWEMIRLCKGQIITAELTGDTSFDRMVGTCYLDDGRDLGAELIKSGLALDFPAYSGGKYKSLETPELRRKLSYIRQKNLQRKSLDQ
jgi:endonuclease YncB( thermonuclease family)